MYERAIDDTGWITSMDWKQLYTYLNAKDEYLHILRRLKSDV